jgi:acyl carrier protein
MRWLPEVRQIMATVMAVPPDAIRSDTVPNDIPAWDSLTHLILVVALETELDIQFRDAEHERMASVADICAVVAGKLGA